MSVTKKKGRSLAVLSAKPKTGPRGIATTRAGTFSKNQITIPTFQDWNKTGPGLTSIGSVAHCGVQAPGGFLYTYSQMLLRYSTSAINSSW